MSKEIIGVSVLRKVLPVIVRQKRLTEIIKEYQTKHYRIRSRKLNAERELVKNLSAIMLKI